MWSESLTRSGRASATVGWSWSLKSWFDRKTPYLLLWIRRFLMQSIVFCGTVPVVFSDASAASIPPVHRLFPVKGPAFPVTKIRRKNRSFCLPRTAAIICFIDGFEGAKLRFTGQSQRQSPCEQLSNGPGAFVHKRFLFCGEEPRFLIQFILFL